MKTILIILLGLFSVGFVFQTKNPFVGTWNLKSEASSSSAFMIINDSAISSFLSVYGVELISTEKQLYQFTDIYLFISNNQKFDTMIYNFVEPTKMVLCDLKFQDSSVWKKDE